MQYESMHARTMTHAQSAVFFVFGITSPPQTQGNTQRMLKNVAAMLRPFAHSA